MVVRRRFRTIVLPVALYGISAAVAAYFLHNAEIGRRGLAAKQLLKIEVFDLNQQLDSAKAERADWDRRIALLRSDQVDRDLLEERARTILGRVHRNDLVIIQN